MPLIFPRTQVYFLHQKTNVLFQTSNFLLRNEINLGATLETHTVYLIYSVSFWGLLVFQAIEIILEQGDSAFFCSCLTRTEGLKVICSPTCSCDVERIDSSVIIMLNEVVRLKHKILFLCWYFSSMKRMILFILCFVLRRYITRSPSYGLMLIVDIDITVSTGAQSQAALLIVIMEQIINSINEEIWTAKKLRIILHFLLWSPNSKSLCGLCFSPYGCCVLSQPSLTISDQDSWTKLNKSGNYNKNMTWQAASGQNYSSIHSLHIQLGWLEMVKIFILLLLEICGTLFLRYIRGL